MSGKNATPTRRVPTQARSQQRVERILDAAAEVFAEVGYEAATTEGIAARAGTSIGSLYQFFPNKKALLYAIAMRYGQRVQTLFEGVVRDADAMDRPWRDLLVAAVDALAKFHREEPGFRALIRNWSSQEFLEYDDAANKEFARRTAMLLAPRMPKLSPARRAIVATVMVETVSSMLIAASRRDDKEANKILAEGKDMLLRWLEPYADGATSKKRRGSPRSSRPARS